MKRRTFAAAAALLAGLASPAWGGAESARPGAGSAWRRSAADAFAEARRADKLVLVELYADWCGWCKVMEREVFADPEFQRYAARFVLLQVDTEDGGEGTELQRRFRANSLPTLLLLDAHATLVGEVRGYMKTKDLVSQLEAAAGRHRELLADFDRVLAGADRALWLAKAKEMHQRGDGRRAARAFEKAIAGGALAGDELGWARLQLADAYRMAERYAEAKKTARALQAELAAAGPGGQSAVIAERVDLLLLYIAGGEHDCGDAAAALDRFEKGHPRSVYLPDARRAFRATTSDGGTQCS
jgi:thiol-disulfide isomerase/thioredoxin